MKLQVGNVDERSPAPVGKWFIHVYPVMFPSFTMHHSHPWLPTVAGFLPSTVCRKHAFIPTGRSSLIIDKQVMKQSHVLIRKNLYT